MAAPQKRHWYQFGLRTLVFAMTLIAAAMGGRANRVNYLANRAAYHRHQAEIGKPDWRKQVYAPYIDSTSNIRTFESNFRYAHVQLSKAYDKAVWRPWTMIEEDNDPFAKAREDRDFSRWLTKQ